MLSTERGFRHTVRTQWMAATYEGQAATATQPGPAPSSDSVAGSSVAHPLVLPSGEAASGKTPHSRPEGEIRFTAAERGLSSAHILTLIQKGKRNMQLCQKRRISEPCITDF